MIKRIVQFFIPEEILQQPEKYRKYRLVVSIILITALFDLNYVGISSMVGLEQGITIMLIDCLAHLFLPFLIRWGVSIVVVTNLYVFFGVFGIVGCTYYSGGFDSPVIVWLASTPIVALLMAGKRTGVAWMIINTIIAVVFSGLSKQGALFPDSVNEEWVNMFQTNTYTGLIIIIFVVALVFENGKNAALKQLAINNNLLAEEKKKNALYAVSQDIHDNVGQRLFLTKLSLSAINLRKDEGKKLNDSIDMLSNAIDELRNISHDINEQNQEDFNLIKAIEVDLKTIEGIGSHKTTFTSSGDFSELNSTTSVTLYRVFQEVVSNILKHAHANEIAADISYPEHQVCLTVTDNGVGFDPQGMYGDGQGLKTIKERMDKINGSVNITSDNGTHVKIMAASH